MSISLEALTISMGVPTLLGIMLCALHGGFTVGRRSLRSQLVLENYDAPTKEDLVEAVQYVKTINRNSNTHSNTQGEQYD